MPKRPRDPNALAARIVGEAVGEEERTEPPAEKDPAAVERGKARAEKLTPEQRSEVARKAARARWESR